MPQGLNCLSQFDRRSFYSISFGVDVRRDLSPATDLAAGDKGL